MLFALVYLLLRWLFQLVTDSSNDLTRDIEVVVLRHQLMVLKRAGGPPASSPSRPAVHGRHQQGPSSSSVVVVRGEHADAPSLAPGAGAKEVDLRLALSRRKASDQR